MTTQACCQNEVPTKADFTSLPIPELLARYRRGVENYDRRVFWLTESQIDTAFLADAGVGQWPVRILLGHMADAELASVHRMRRAAAEENPMLSAWDENAFVDSGIYGKGSGQPAAPEVEESRVAHALGGFIAIVHTLRQWNGQWLQTLPENLLDRRAMHPEKGALTIRTMVAGDTWHLEHHARFLRLKLDKLVGQNDPRQRDAMEGGGCGAGCGCHKK